MKNYVIEVLEQNRQFKNHCIKPSDWRIRCHRPICFGFGLFTVTVTSDLIKNYIDNHHECFRHKTEETISETTGEVIVKTIHYCLIPDSYIMSVGVRV